MENKNDSPIYNGFIQTKKPLSLIEKRILYRIIECVKKMCDESPSCFKDETGWKKAILTISKQDMSSCGSKFDEVLNATEKLKEHRIDQRGNTAKLVSSIMYNHSKSEFTIKLSGLMTFYWVELSSYYSVQEINIASALTSRFSQVFYEMLCLDKTLKSTSLSVAELKNIIGIEEKYERVKDLRRYVIDRAYSEIKDLFDQKECDSYFSVVPVKSGRTITAFEFKIHRRTERNNVSKWSQKSESHFRFVCEELIRYAGHDSRYVTNILRSIRGNSELTIQVARAIRKIIKYYKTQESSNETIGYAIRTCLACDFNLTN